MVHDTQNTPYNSIHQTVEGEKPYKRDREKITGRKR
jgi:hypothetical protein